MTDTLFPLLLALGLALLFVWAYLVWVFLDTHKQIRTQTEHLAGILSELQTQKKRPDLD